MHSHVEAFCFSTIDLNDLSVVIEVAKADAGAVSPAAAEVGIVSVLSVEGKMVDGFCDFASVDFSLLDDDANVVESLFTANEL